LKIFIAFSTLIILFGCSSLPRFYLKELVKSEKGNSTVISSNESKIETFNNLPNSVESVTGVASFYSDAFDGKKTANGETYNMLELTAAHRTYPFNTMIRVINLANNKSVIVRINDRGPVPEDRIIDLSLGAAIQLGMDKTGLQEVRLEVIEIGIN